MNLDEGTFKQLEEKYGLNTPERTEVIIGFENMLNVTRYGFSIVKKGFESLWDSEFISIIPTYFADGVQEATALVKEKGIHIRIITEIKKENLASVKQLSNLYEVRHLQGIKGNFGILDRRQYIVMMFSSYDKPPEQTLFSNSKSFVEQQQYVFDKLWENAIPSKIKIKQIEMANEPEYMKSVSDQQELNKILTELTECSVKEILILLPRPVSFNFLMELGISKALPAVTIRDVDIRVILAGVVGKVDHEGDIEKLNKNIKVRYLSTELPNNRIDIIIDYKFTLSIEVNYFDKTIDRQKEKRLATHSNIESRAMVSSSIFENY